MRTLENENRTMQKVQTTPPKEVRWLQTNPGKIQGLQVRLRLGMPDMWRGLHRAGGLSRRRWKAPANLREMPLPVPREQNESPNEQTKTNQGPKERRATRKPTLRHVQLRHGNQKEEAKENQRSRSRGRLTNETNNPPRSETTERKKRQLDQAKHERRRQARDQKNRTSARAQTNQSSQESGTRTTQRRTETRTTQRKQQRTTRRRHKP
jgi:hypothetical protein